MAQHDYSIANGTGSAVRSDLNDALAAIVSLNSGATEPATTFAFQLWADTTANVLKLRNSANNAWITLRQLDGDFTTVSVDNGTAAAPSVFFNASGTDTGFYSSGTDAVDVSTAGTRRLGVGSAGDVTVFGGNVTLNAQGDLRFADSDSSNWVAFQAPATVASNVTWTLPSADGTSGQTLQTNGSGTLSWVTPSATVDKIEEGNTSAEVVDTGSDGHFKVITEGTEAFRIDASQDYLFKASNPVLKLYNSTNETATLINDNGGGTSIRLASNSLIFADDGNNEKARINSGRLLVGTSTNNAGYKLQVVHTDSTGVLLGSFNGGTNYLSTLSSNGSEASKTIVSSGQNLFTINVTGYDGSANRTAATISAYVDGTPGANDMPGRLAFSVTKDGASSPTERMRIHESGQTAFFSTTDNCIRAVNSAGAGTTYANYFGHHSGSSVTSTGTLSYVVYTNGNVQNTNGSYTQISDAKLKENIVDANSQWDDIKAIRIRNWNFKEETGHETYRQIGLVAQELEQVCPGLVFETPDRDEDGNETGEVTKGVNQSILYMKAVKALQEAMERIETLETANASLEARLTALENA